MFHLIINFFRILIILDKHKKMKFLLALLSLVSTQFCLGQKTIPKVLEKLNSKTVPYITVEELQNKKEVVMLDTREINEFNVSHIKNALHVGYNNFDKNKITLELPNKNANIVVYCSIGVRSERIGEKLLKMGYKNVYNLYGGIFEWKNNNGIVVNNKNMETDDVHTFNKKWSQYLKKGRKIYND